jgi:hypothetical protein
MLKMRVFCASLRWFQMGKPAAIGFLLPRNAPFLRENGKDVQAAILSIV